MLSNKITLLPVPIQKSIYKIIYIIIGIFFHHFRSKSRKDIFVFSTRRGGSTLLGQILTANKGIRNIDQPLTSYAPSGIGGMLRQEVTGKYLEDGRLSQFPSVNHSKEHILKAYISGLLAGKILLSPWLEFKASSKKYHFYTDRTMLKFTGANAIINWVSDNYDAHIVYLSRHPIPNAISIMNNKWTITAEAYLNDKEYCQRYLTPEQMKYSKAILQKNNYFQCAILNWCLENIVPLNYLPTDAICITYEEIVISPREVIEYLCQKLQLEEKELMYQVSQKPSFSTVLSELKTVRDISSKTNLDDKYNTILNRWASKVSQEDKDLAQTVLDMFDIDIYSAKDSIPDTKYLNYPDLFVKRITEKVS